jgi:uncharacterized protein (UPF0276 family)
MNHVPQIGVGLQYNPEILDWFPFEDLNVDALEILLDTIAGPLDSPYIMLPGSEDLLQRLGSKYSLIAHSNYGGEFGFGPLEESAAVLRHVPLTRQMQSPWVADHCFYGEESWADIWSSPLQFSRAEATRLAERAYVLQDLYGVPLAHENAARYVTCPGSDLSEPEFLAILVEKAGTWLHLDLHNIYANSINFPNCSVEKFLDTIPLERVIEIHLAGGSWSRGFYHDWHDDRVPEAVWDMLKHVLARSRPGAVILEFQGRAHHPDTRVLGGEADLEIIKSDLARATALWNNAYQPGTREQLHAS